MKVKQISRRTFLKRMLGIVLGIGFIGFFAKNVLGISRWWDGPDASIEFSDVLTRPRTLVHFTVYHNEPQESGFATPMSINERPLLNFDQSTDETAAFSGIIDKNYKENDVTVKIWWTGGTTTGNVRWQARFEALEDLDLDNDGFAAYRSQVDTTNATKGKLTETTITFTNVQADSITAGDPFRIMINRDATSGTDTMAADAQLYFVEIRED